MDATNLRKVAKNVKSFVKNNYSRDVNVRMWVMGSKGVYKPDYNYCHGKLKLNTYGDSWTHGTPVAVINQLQEYRSGEEIAKRYFEWLLHYSPYRDVFITKNVKKAIENHVIVATAEAPSNLLGGAMIASRACSENYCGNQIWKRSFVWDALVRYGLHPNAALAAAQFLYPKVSDDSSNALPTTVTLSDNTSGHAPLAFDDNTLLNFTEDKPKNVGSPYAKAKTYGYIHSMWNYTRPSKTNVETIIDEALKKTEEQKKQKNNPFDVQAPGRKSYPFNEAMEEVAMALSNTLKAQPNAA